LPLRSVYWSALFFDSRGTGLFFNNFRRGFGSHFLDRLHWSRSRIYFRLRCWSHFLRRSRLCYFFCRNPRTTTADNRRTDPGLNHIARSTRLKEIPKRSDCGILQKREMVLYSDSHLLRLNDYALTLYADLFGKLINPNLAHSSPTSSFMHSIT
jgi:hypothetical protein